MPEETSSTIGSGSTTPDTTTQTDGNSTTANGNGSTSPDQVRRRSEQDQEVAQAISSTRKAINVVLTDAVVRAALGKKGFDTQKLSEGLALCDAADAKWNARQEAIAKQSNCTSLVNGLFDEARKSLSDLRETARVAFKEEAALKALGVTGDVPEDVQRFLTHARSTYTTAKKEEYNGALARHGYATEELDRQLAALEDLRKASDAQSQVMGDAQQATRARDDAVAPVREFRKNILKIARRAFRKEPEQARKLAV